jgi:DNA polymerase-3 subunit epsilon
LILALAHRAVDDGHVSRAERSELDSMAALLSVPADKVLDVIKHADSARSKRLSAGLKTLPADWAHGEPLRVGDRVAFTGCDEQQRERLEKHANGLGVRVLGNLSRLSVMLVTDGSFTGTKANKAKELGTRVVHPDHFEVMLTHLQPTLAIFAADAPVRRAHQIAPATSASASRVPASASPSTIRAWALAQGYEVGIRGRLPAEVLKAYEASAVVR